MAASTSLMRAQRANLLQYVGRQVRDSVLSEDIVQEAYLRLLSFEAKPDAIVNDRPAFLRRISLNLVRDHFRKAKTASAVELTDILPS